MSRGDAIMLRGRAAWAHDDGSDGGINAAFQTLPGAAFTVNGAAPPRNLALLSAGGEYRFAQRPLARRRASTASSHRRSQTYAGTGTARYVW